MIKTKKFLAVFMSLVVGLLSAFTLVGCGEGETPETPSNETDAFNTSISDVTETFVYDGTAKIPTVVVKSGDTVLTEDEDYTITLENNVNAGMAKIKVTFIGEYAEAKPIEKTFKINPCDASGAIFSVTSIGLGEVPVASVTLDGYALEEGRDYDVNYGNYSVLANSVTATITFKGNFTGTKQTTYKVEPVSTQGVLFTLDTTTDTYYVSGYEGTETDIFIASSYQGKPVTAIGAWALAYAEVVSVKMGNGITKIESGAFENCANLVSITVSDELNYIGRCAFDNCPNMTFNMEGDLKYIGSETNDYVGLVGSQTSEITNVNVNQNCKVIGDEAFCYYSSVESVMIPEGVTDIGMGAFQDCSLTEVTIPSTVKNIAHYAFYSCANLQSLEILNAPVTIGSDAFNSCGLTSVSLGNNVKSISDNAFAYCMQLESVIIPDSVTDLGGYAFYWCSKLASVTIGSGIKTIADDIFSLCESLDNVIIPEGVVSIGSGVFNRCEQLKTIVIPSTVTSIASDAFKDSFSECPLEMVTMPMLAIDYIPKTNLKSVVISNGTELKASAFSSCSNLERVQLPQSVTSIGSSAFGYCSKLQTVNIPNGITTISNYTFEGCSSLGTISLPGSLTTIGEEAFYGSGITSISIPSTVTSIGNDAFVNCSKLVFTTEGNLKYLGNSSNPYLYLAGAIPKGTSYTTFTSASINDGCKIIANSAFETCIYLKSIKMSANVVAIGDRAFASCQALTSLVIPSTVTTIGENAFRFCSVLSSIILPASVETVGENAFYRCDALSIKCEAQSKPDGWHNKWNYSNRPVTWGYGSTTNP